jgi:enoyl-CoA hydratase
MGTLPAMNMDHDFKAVLVEAKDGVLEITLNRPERLNTFNEDMRLDFMALQHRIESDASLRVVIFSGAGGRAFGAGADVGFFEVEWTSKHFRAQYRWIHDFFDSLERVEVPVIAAVHGTCACGGLELAMACDFIIAAEDTRFGFTEGNINLIPGSGGCSRLSRQIGPMWAKELVLAGEFIDARRAYALGLTTRVVARDKLMDEARTLAEKLKAKAPQALGASKQLINTCQSIDASSARVLERMAQSALILTEDHKEGIRAFREKRRPEYTGR